MASGRKNGFYYLFDNFPKNHFLPVNTEYETRKFNRQVRSIILVVMIVLLKIFFLR